MRARPVCRRPSSVVRAVDEELLDIRHLAVGLPDPRRMYLPDFIQVVVILGISSQTICCPANVECGFHDWITSSADRNPSRCDPEQYPITGRTVSEFRGRPWTPCLSATGWDVSTTDLAYHEAIAPSAVTKSTSAAARAAHSASGSASVARVVTGEERS